MLRTRKYMYISDVTVTKFCVRNPQIAEPRCTAKLLTKVYTIPHCTATSYILIEEV